MQQLVAMLHSEHMPILLNPQKHITIESLEELKYIINTNFKMLFLRISAIFPRDQWVKQTFYPACGQPFVKLSFIPDHMPQHIKVSVGAEDILKQKCWLQ